VRCWFESYQIEVCWEALEGLAVGTDVLDGHLDSVKGVEDVHYPRLEKIFSTFHGDKFTFS
jgi:hypothetical protein